MITCESWFVGWSKAWSVAPIAGEGILLHGIPNERSQVWFRTTSPSPGQQTFLAFLTSELRESFGEPENWRARIERVHIRKLLGEETDS